MRSGDIYVIVFQEAQYLGLSVGYMLHKLVVADLLAAENLQTRGRLNGYELFQPESWRTYDALVVHGGLHVTLDERLPVHDYYEFAISGYKFMPALNSDNPREMPGFYALDLRSVSEPPIEDVFDYHASVAQLFKN